MNRISFGSSANDAAPNVSCPKCGGTKPTCCSCPDEANYEAIAREALARHPLRLGSIIGGGPYAELVSIFAATLRTQLYAADRLRAVTVEARIKADKGNAALRDQLAEAQKNVESLSQIIFYSK